MQKALRILYCLLFQFIVFVAFSQGEVATIIQKGHSESAKAVAISHNGELLATASRDKTVKLWNVNSGHEIRTFRGHEHTANSLSFSSNGEFLASGSADNTAVVWDVKSGDLLWRSPKTSRYTTSVAFHPTKNWLVVAGHDSPLKVWDWKKNEVVAELKCNPDIGSGYGINASFSSDGRWLAIGEDNRTARVIEVATWEEKYSFKPEEGWCGGCGTQVAFSPNNKFLARASDRGDFNIYDLQTGKVTYVLMQLDDDATALQFSNDGSQLMMTSEDSVFVFDAHSGKQLIAFKPGLKQINHATFTLDNNLVLADDNGVCSNWNVQTNSLIQNYSGTLNERDFGGLDHDLSNYWKRHIAKHLKYKNEQLLINDAYLLRGKMGQNGMLWGVKQGKPSYELVGHEKAVICFDKSSDENELITGGGDGLVIRWNADNGKAIQRYEGHRDPVFDVSFSNDGKKMASCGWGGNVIVWDVATGEKLSKIYFDQVAAYNLTFTENDEYLILGLLDKTLQLWDIDSQTKVKDFVGHTDNVTSIELLPGGQEFVSTSKDGRAIRWHVGFGLKENKVVHPQGAIYAQAFLEEPKQLITAGEDRIIRVWSSDYQKVQRQLIGHQGEITSLSLSADQRTLYSLDLDGVTKVWNLESGKEVYEYVQLNRAEWLIKSPQGFFSGTPQAMKKVHFVKGLNSYSLDQFFDKFYQPEKIGELLEYGVLEEQEGIEQFIAKNTPPGLKIAAVVTSDQKEADVFVKIIGKYDNHIPLKHNGKLVGLISDDWKEVEQEATYRVFKTRVPLVSGHNDFSCRIRGKNGAESGEGHADVMSNIPTPGANCYVVAIGINKYKNGRLDLNYAKADAQSFADSIAKFGKGIYKEINVLRLFDKTATKAHVLAQLDSLAEVISINDVFMFYFAGHGSVTDGHFYFVTSDATRLYSDNGEMGSQAITESEMMGRFEKIKALKQVIVMDACQSGSAVDFIAMRGAREEKAIAQLSRSAGVHVFAAAGSEQFATEYADLGHGIFTYCLLQALSGASDGAPKDGKVTIFELKSFIDDQVPTLSMKYKGVSQYPYTFSKGHDFPLVIPDK